MNSDLYYYTIEKPSVAEFKDKGSRFLAYAFPISNVEDFKKHLQELKKEHPKAVHHCFAYRLGLDGNNFRVSDDGEPNGTAGKPILNVIDSKQMTNVLVVVVRYFGGTLLGVPGLINAYKSATAMAFQVVPIIQKSVEINYELQFDYTRMNDVMVILKQCNCNIIKQENQLFSIVQMGVPKVRLEEVLSKLKDLHTVDVKRC
ncbi:IMPACT family protein [Parasediminibacterium paludis]|uniref:IMPACT family protein n=1 Tax=Parasediminibacterium paludis TaxID=908966 RepID=A0ABV8PV55_9BACT